MASPTRSSGAARPSSPLTDAPPGRVLLDARIPAGGSAAYARRLEAGLRQAACWDVSVVGPARSRRPFTPWGRAVVATEVARAGAQLVHGLHVEAPPARVPVVVTVHDVIPLDHPASLPNPLARAVYRRVLQTSVRRAATVIVPSPASAERLVAQGVDGERVEVIPLAYGRQFRPLSPAEREEARLRFAGGRRYVVVSTGRRAHKNLDGAVRAAALLPPDVVVAATGAVAGYEDEPVRFVGVLDDDVLPHFYGAAEAVVLPAFVEGFGLPAVEALACGVPVVCGPGTGALPSIRPGALEVDVASPHELAAGIRTLLTDERLRTELATAGRAAVAPLTIDAMTAATMAVYDRATSR